MTKTKEEGYRVLNYLGVAEEVQSQFSSIIHEETSGKLYFLYRNKSDEMVDKEFFTLCSFKKAARGMAVCCPARKEWVTDIYVSHSMLNLIAFCHYQYKRYSFDHSAFFSTGVKPERDLFLRNWKECNKGKIHLLFGNFLMGRILDCKLAHWVRGEDFTFYLGRNQIVSSNSMKKSFTIPQEGFSMRSYFRRIGGKAKATTHKPSQRSIDNYIHLLTNKTLQP